MKFPLATVATLFILGILCGEYVRAPLPWLFISAFSLLLATIFISRVRPYTLAALVFVSGWTNYCVQTEILSASDLRLLAGERTIDTRLQGRISALDVRRYDKDGKERWRTLAKVRVEALRANEQWQPAEGTVLVSTSESLAGHFHAGQHVEIGGILHRPARPVAKGLFDYRAFLEWQNIHYQLDAELADWTSLERSPSRPVSEWFLDWARKTLFLGLNEEDQSLRLIWAMTLGWRSGMDHEVSEDFMRSGTMHIFAISGLHIALISGILVQLLRVLRVPRAWCGSIVIPLLWFYTAATGWQSSAIRSSLMMTIVIGGWSLKRPANLLNSLGASGFIILAWEPQQLFQASFQLSFFVVLSLALLLPSFEKLRERLLQPDPLLPPDLLPKWRRVIGVPARWLAMMFITSLAAWIGSLPFVAYYFHLVTPITLLANVIIVPLSSWALMCNLGSLLCGALLPAIAELFNHSGWFFMEAMVHTTEWFANSPGAYFYVPAPTLIQCSFYFITVFSIITGAVANARWQKWILAVITVLLGASLWQFNQDTGTWKITILPVEGGEAVFVDAPGRDNNLLIDCGNANSVEYVTKPFLRSQGVNTLPTLILTHGDLKNMGGATNIITEFNVHRVVTSAVKFRSTAYRSMVDWLNQRADLRGTIKQGDRFGKWTVLHPASGDKFSQADDGPVVLRGEIHRTRLLLLSDLSRSSQHLLWDRVGHLLSADIVIAGLPRESEPLNDDLLNQINPKLIIITDSEFPASERATSALRQRLGKRGLPVLYCRDAGAVTLSITHDGFTCGTALEPRNE